MSTEDSTIRVVRTDMMLLIGDCEGGEMKQPRVVANQQQPNGQNLIVFLPLAGHPQSLRLSETAFSYEPEAEMITAYRESVTGLTMAKVMPKVIQERLG